MHNVGYTTLEISRSRIKLGKAHRRHSDDGYLTIVEVDDEEQRCITQVIDREKAFWFGKQAHKSSLYQAF